MSLSFGTRAARELSELSLEDPGFAARISSSLADSRFDALVALSPENFHYVSAVWMPMARGYLDRQNLAIWPRNDRRG